ncbi:MAG: adenylate kinase family protein [Candidatus Woesearchaeota archaeon]
MKAIIVTGTPATGKTTFAKQFAKEKGYFYLDLNNLIKENRIYSGYDRKRKSYIVDIRRLIKPVVKIIRQYKGKVVIDSHLSHYLPPKYVRLCIVTKCPLKTLKRRLEKRGYSKAKIRENLDAEIFDVCFIEAKEMGHRVKVIEQKL